MMSSDATKGKTRNKSQMLELGRKVAQAPDWSHCIVLHAILRYFAVNIASL